MNQDDDLLDRYLEAIASERMLRRQRREAIASKDQDNVRVLSEKLIVAQQMRLQLKAAVAELEPIDTQENPSGRTTPNRIRFLWAGLMAAVLVLLMLAWGLKGVLFPPTILATATPTVASVTSSPSNVPTLPSIIPTLPNGSVVTVLVSNANPPFSSSDPSTGKTTGWAYDTLDAICQQINCTTSFVEVSDEGLIQQVASGDKNSIAADGIAITKERAEVVDFSMPYLEVYQTVVARMSESRFTDANALKAGDFKVGVQVGTTSDVFAQNFVGSDRVAAFTTLEAAFEALKANTVDAVIADSGQATKLVRDSYRDSLTMLSDKLDVTQYAFAFPRGSALVTPVNKAISDLRSSGQLARLYLRWFSSVS